MNGDRLVSASSPPSFDPYAVLADRFRDLTGRLDRFEERITGEMRRLSDRLDARERDASGFVPIVGAAKREDSGKIRQADLEAVRQEVLAAAQAEIKKTLRPLTAELPKTPWGFLASRWLQIAAVLAGVGIFVLAAAGMGVVWQEIKPLLGP